MKRNDEGVLAMAVEVFERVSVITEPIEFRKKYDSADEGDPYGEVIRWTYLTGGKLFSE